MSHCSPATASRCQIIYVPRDPNGWVTRICSWINTTPHVFSAIREKIRVMAIEYMGQVVIFLSGCSSGEDTPPEYLVGGFLQLYGHLLQHVGNVVTAVTADETESIFWDSKGIYAAVEGTLLYALVWSTGAMLSEKDKIEFDVLIRSLCRRSMAFTVEKLGVKINARMACVQVCLQNHK